MAERRMFAKTIIDSDAFLEMSATAQLLYFHLSMRADDDGFVNKPKSIMRMCGSSESDINELYARKFIIPFESGIVVIKHWKIHNYIRKDAYSETKYKEEKAALSYDDNGAYRLNNSPPVTVLSHECDESVAGMLTQDRSGQERIGKDSIDGAPEVVSSETSISESHNYSALYSEVVSLYNTICISYSKVTKLSDARKKAIRARLNTYTIADFRKLFEAAENSLFLKGANNRNWSASFDWLISDRNFAKVLDGNYDNKKAVSVSPADKPDFTDTNRYENINMEV